MTKFVLVNLGDGRKYSQIDKFSGLSAVGLEFIASHLINNGFDAEVIDQSMQGYSNTEIVELVLKSNADIIGFNPLINTRKQCEEIISEIRKQKPEILTVVGGYDATFNKLKDYSNVDLLVRGAGEKAALEIAKRFQNNSSFEDIQGVAYGTKEKVVEKSNELAEELSLNELPIPVRQNMKYLLENNEPVSIVSSRGCDYTCKFCSAPAMYPEGRKERPVSEMKKEIDYLAKAGVKMFSFWEEDFFGFTEESLKHADEIIKYVGEKDGRITFCFITTPAIHLAEKLGYFKSWEGTLNRIYVGIEGGCTEALINLGKRTGMLISVHEEAVNIVRKYNICLQIGFIMFNPYSSFQELTDSANFLLKNNEAVNAISFFHHLRPYNATEMYFQLKKDGLLIEEETKGEIDRYIDLPYHFKQDLESNTIRLKDFAIAVGKIAEFEESAELDKLNNEIYLSLVALGHGKELFSETDNKQVNEYKAIRKELSDLNYNFFMDCLKTFKENKGHGFEEKKKQYLNTLKTYLPKLQEIRKNL